MHHRFRSRSTRSFAGLILATTLSLPACEQAPPDPAEAAARQIVGSAGQGGDPAAGAVWQQAFEAWPTEGNLSIVYGDPRVQAALDMWMMGQTPPRPLPEEGAQVLEKVRRFNDRLVDLDGAWGPIPDPSKVRDMSVRGMRKTLWFDARAAVAERNVDRLVDVLVVMANLPRVSHAYDASVRGLIATVGLADGLSWALRDAATPEFEIELDPEDCARLRQAAGWLDQNDAFGVADPELDPDRANVLAKYDGDTRVRVRETLGKHCP